MRFSVGNSSFVAALKLAHDSKPLVNLSATKNADNVSAHKELRHWLFRLQRTELGLLWYREKSWRLMHYSGLENCALLLHIIWF